MEESANIEASYIMSGSSVSLFSSDGFDYSHSM
jgi:hypothetical protein